MITKKNLLSIDIPLGMATHNTEITLGKSAKLAEAVGAAVELIAKKGKSAT